MKKTIRAKITFSYIVVVIASLITVGVLFSYNARKYMENNAKKSLMQDAAIIAEIVSYDIIRSNELFEWEIIRMIREQYRTGFSTSDRSMAVIYKNYKVVIPSYSMEALTIQNVVLPQIKKFLETEKKGFTKFSIDKVSYIGAVVPTENAWIIIYTPIGEVRELTSGLVYVLVITMILAGLLAVIFGAFIARSIAKPIIMLKNRAELLSKRDFDSTVHVKTGDEIEELANTINKMAVELKEYDIAQKKFLQNASHEFKTPLMSIQGYAEGIKDGVFDDNEHALNIIIEESQRLNSIVQDVIYLSKLETMEDYYSFNRENINVIIEKSVEKLESIALKSNIKIKKELCENVFLNIDKDKMIQAFINILGNCLRYAKSEILISTKVTGGKFIIQICDDGEGFNEEELSNVFERFYKGKKGNTGLGLAITKKIIEKHGGTIKAGNRPEGGAQFTVTLKL